MQQRTPSLHRAASSSGGAGADVVRRRRAIPEDGLGLQDFVSAGGAGATSAVDDAVQRVEAAMVAGAAEDLHPDHPRTTFHIQTYGCQMNVADSQIVGRILLDAGLAEAGSSEAADVVLLNTCAIREKAEAKVWGRLTALRREDKDATGRGGARRRRTVGVRGGGLFLLPPPLRCYAATGLIVLLPHHAALCSAALWSPVVGAGRGHHVSGAGGSSRCWAAWRSGSRSGCCRRARAERTWWPGRMHIATSPAW